MYFLDSIKSLDRQLQAAMANVRQANAADREMNNFEDMIAFVVPHCPVARKNSSGTKCGAENVSSDDIQRMKSHKTGNGVTRVEL